MGFFNRKGRKASDEENITENDISYETVVPSDNGDEEGEKVISEPTDTTEEQEEVSFDDTDDDELNQQESDATDLVEEDDGTEPPAEDALSESIEPEETEDAPVDEESEPEEESAPEPFVPSLDEESLEGLPEWRKSIARLAYNGARIADIETLRTLLEQMEEKGTSEAYVSGLKEGEVSATWMGEKGTVFVIPMDDNSFDCYHVGTDDNHVSRNMNVFSAMDFVASFVPDNEANALTVGLE